MRDARAHPVHEAIKIIEGFKMMDVFVRWPSFWWTHFWIIAQSGLTIMTASSNFLSLIKLEQLDPNIFNCFFFYLQIWKCSVVTSCRIVVACCRIVAPIWKSNIFAAPRLLLSCCRCCCLMFLVVAHSLPGCGKVLLRSFWLLPFFWNLI